MLFELKGALPTTEGQEVPSCVFGTTDRDETGTYHLETGHTVFVDMSGVVKGARRVQEVSLRSAYWGGVDRKVQLNRAGRGQLTLPGREWLSVQLQERLVPCTPQSLRFQRRNRLREESKYRELSLVGKLPE